MPHRLLALFAAFLLLWPVGAAARTNSPRTLSAVTHGVRVTLTVPRLVYPRGALAVFTVTLRNVSSTNRYLQDFQPDYGGPYSPHILMRLPSGSLVYEEQLSQFLAPSPGDLNTNFVLHPGQSLTRHIRFVLEAATVQAMTRVSDGYTAFSGGPSTPPPPPSAFAHHLWHISSPWLHLTLTSEPAPKVTVTRFGNRIHVSASAPRPVTGPLYYMDSARCWFHGGVMSTDQHVPWTRAAGKAFTSTVTRRCPSAQPYRAVLGWLNHPVARVDVRDVQAIAAVRAHAQAPLTRPQCPHSGAE